MKTRKATADKNKPKKSKRMKGLVQFHDYKSFDELIDDIETTLVEEMEKPRPNWSRGVKELLPHIHWKYDSGDVDASEDRKEEGKYENMLLSLCLCDKKLIKEKPGYPCTNKTLHPWFVVKESGIEGAGLGLFAKKRFLPGKIITIYFAPQKSKQRPTFTKYAVHTKGHYFYVRQGCPLFLGAHFMNDATYNCTDADREKLEEDNNAYFDGITIKAKTRIESGCEILLSYNLYYN